jgi:hypothetical protein
VNHLHREHDFLEDEPLFAHLERVTGLLLPAADELTTITGWLHHIDETHVHAGTIEAKFGVRVTRAVALAARLPREPDAPYAWRVGQARDPYASAALSACFSDLATHHSTATGRARWKAAYDQLELAKQSVKELS